MSRFLLDTGPLMAWLEGQPRAGETLRPWIRGRQSATSVLCYGEVVEYLLALPDRTRRRRELRPLLHEIEQLQLTMPILDRYAELRRRMRRPHGSGTIGDIDTLIAATALERDLTVVSTDRDFARVPGLKVIVLLPVSLKGS